MKKLVLILLLVTGVSSAYSQADWTKAKCFAEMDKIVKKTNGLPVLSGIYGRKATLISQSFSATLITKTIREEPAKKGDSPLKMTYRYTKIPWDKLKSYSFNFIVREKTEAEKTMLQLELRFDTDKIQSEFIYNDKKDDTVVDGTHLIDEIYFYEKDKDWVESIMKRLLELK